VKASGGEPMTMSSGVALSTWRGQASQAASTSRWRVHGGLGLAGGAEVKASSAMSSAAVGQAVNVAGLRATSAQDPADRPAR
jgi:hypothetical protein